MSLGLAFLISIGSNIVAKMINNIVAANITTDNVLRTLTTCRELVTIRYL
nr:hypothetical protein [Orientia tsutsugamushi]